VPKTTYVLMAQQRLDLLPKTKLSVAHLAKCCWRGLVVTQEGSAIMSYSVALLVIRRLNKALTLIILTKKPK